MKTDEVLNEILQSTFRSLVGQIGYVANGLRPDLCFDKISLSTVVAKATVSDLKSAIKVIRKIKSEKTVQRFPELGSVDKWTILGYGDAGFRSLPDKVSSCGGHALLIINSESKAACVVSWRSRKLRRVVSSSSAAEALAANDILDEMFYVKELLKEIVGQNAEKVSLELITDSQNLYRAVMSTTVIENPRSRTDIVKIKQSLRSGELACIRQVPSAQVHSCGR